MNTNKIGFSNFKAFGEKMHTFSKKPITLVYGPNSIGKSSLLHSQLYLAYLKNMGIERDLYKTNFAGDELDFGGFENFVHKMDVNNIIKYESTYRDPNNIEDLLSSNYLEILALKNQGFFNTNFSLKKIEQIFESFQKDFIFELKNVLKIVINNKELKRLNELENVFSSSDLDTYIDLTKKQIKLSQALLFVQYCKTENIDIKKYISENRKDLRPKDFEDRYKSAINKIEKSEDMFMYAFVLSLKVTPIDIFNRLSLMEFISNISNIELKVEFRKENDNVLSVLKYFIDNELIFESNETSTQHSVLNINKNSRLYKLVDLLIADDGKINKKEVDKLNEIIPSLGLEEIKVDVDAVNEMHQNFIGHFPPTQLMNDVFGRMPDTSIVSSRSADDAVHRIMKNAIVYMNKYIPVQYFGPLRFYPQRWNMFEKNKEKTSTDNETSFFQLKDNFMFKKPLIYLNINFWTYMIKSGAFNDAINQILPNNMKLSSVGVYSSEKMWSRLIQSNEIQKKLNKWFSDESKLKTPYEVVVHEYDIKYNKVYKFIRNIFGLKQEIKKMLSFTDKRTDTLVTPRDMGLGISQVLPILISCLSSKKTNIFLEQPELHLHPAVQAELADEFIRSYKERDNEFMIETHSEHLLLRIMKRMRYAAEDRQDRDKTLDLTPNDVCLLYVDSDGESTYIRELRLNVKGKLLDHWPNGFFEEGFKERFS